MRSTKAPARPRSTRPATDAPAPSSARRGWAAATAAGCRSTAPTTTSAFRASARSTTPPSRSRPGCRRAAPKNDVGIVGTWTGNGPMLWIDHIAGRHQLTLGGSLSTYLDSGVNPIVGQWQHLAATFDGTTARYLRRRRRGGIAGGLGQRRQLEHVADRRLRQRARRLLRRRDRRAPRLRPRARRRGDPGRPRPAARDRRPGRADGAREPHRHAETPRPSVSLGWTASTDDSGRRRLHHLSRTAPSPGRRRRPSFTVTGLACSTSHQLEVEAFDASGNTSPRATASGATTAVRLDAGPRRRRTRSRRDRARSPTTRPATVATGRSPGRAGLPAATAAGSRSTASTTTSPLGALGTFYNTAFTLEAWVQKAGAKKDVGIVGTWSGSGPMLWVDHLAGHNYAHARQQPLLVSRLGPEPGRPGSGSTSRPPSTAPPPATTSTGLEVAARATSGSVGSSNTWRIGAYGGTPGGFFDGVVDDVRIYNRALSAGEIQFDRDHGVARRPRLRTRLRRRSQGR